jgi:hypothetical protein
VLKAFRKLATLLLILAMSFAVSSVYLFIERLTCRIDVTREVARDLIEQDLAEPSSRAIIRGKPPIIEDIHPDIMSVPDCPECKTFEFRLRGTSPDEWGYAVVDECGNFELSGYFAGKF